MKCIGRGDVSDFLRRMFLWAAFWILMTFVTVSYGLLLPAIVLPRLWVLGIVRSYLCIVLWLLRKLFGLRWQISGDLAAAKGPVLVAAKHQSGFETLILQYELGDPAIILKRNCCRSRSSAGSCGAWATLGWIAPATWMPRGSC